MMRRLKKGLKPESFKVLQLADFAAAYPGSFFGSLLRLEEALKKTGGDMVCVLPQRAKAREWTARLISEGHRIYFLPDNPLKAVLFLRKVIRENGINIIHSHFVHGKLFCILRLARLGMTDIPHFVHLRSIQNNPKPTGLRKLIRNKIIAATAFICVSRGVAEYGGVENDFELCGNAIDFSRLDSGERLPPREDGRLRLMMFGYNFDIKGVDTAIKALEKYDKSGRYALYIVIANDAEKSKTDVERLLGGVPDWIELLPPRNDIAVYYRTADIFVSASRREGFSNALVEAAYCGCPAVASDVPGQNELGIPYTVYFSAGYESALFEAVERVWATSDGEKNMQVDARKTYVINNFDLNAWCEKIIGIYRRRGRGKIEQNVQ